jgi:hypothetical protein
VNSPARDAKNEYHSLVSLIVANGGFWVRIHCHTIRAERSSDTITAKDNVVLRQSKNADTEAITENAIATHGITIHIKTPYSIIISLVL